MLRPLWRKCAGVNIITLLKNHHTRIANNHKRRPCYDRIFAFVRTEYNLVMITTLWTLVRNYLLTALRYLSRHKVFSIVNIACLTIGMACSFLLLVWVEHELSYDRFHQDASRIFRVRSHIPFTGETIDVAVSPQALGKIAGNQVEGIETVVRIRAFPKPALRYREKVFYEKGVILADPGFFRVFTYPFLQGDPGTCLAQPGSIVLSKELADKYFGDKDPIGRDIEINNLYKCRVTAVIGEAAGPTHLPFKAIIPLNLFHKDEEEPYHYRNYNTLTYCLLEQGASPEVVATRITSVFHNKNPFKEVEEDQLISYHLDNIKQLHLSGEKVGEMQQGSSWRQIVTFLVIGLVILLIAIINFLNHMTARARLRFREIAVRKALGATRGMLIQQFLGESVLISLLSYFLAMSLLEIVVPFFGRFLLEGMSFVVHENMGLAMAFFGISLMSGVLAGIYPALALSGLEPFRIFRGDALLIKGRKGLRQSLVIVQFSVSIALIASALMVGRQVRFVQQKELGFNQKNILVMAMNESLQPKYELFRDSLMRIEGVDRVSASSSLPMFGTALTSQIRWEGMPEKTEVKVNFAFVDFDYFRTLEIPILRGRCFVPGNSGDDSLAFIVNEHFVDLIGSREILGLPLTFREYRHGRVIGVVKDHHFSSLHHPIGPMVYMLTKTEMNHILVRIDPFRTDNTIRAMTSAWDGFSGLFPFDADFLEDRYVVLYEREAKMYALLVYFSILAALISFLGLFGLASFLAEQRMKEIGIRKVYGATPGGIAWQHLLEVVKWVLLSGLLALPVSWYLMDRWLDRFAYATTLAPSVMLIAIAGGLVTAIIASSWQVVLSARLVPSAALRYE